MKRSTLLNVFAALVLVVLPTSTAMGAGFTETLKAGTFLIDASYVKAWINSRWERERRQGRPGGPDRAL
ncbi:MAG: hypothetical protein GXP54_02760 [Deltaproteobacteria bacterium]|nr:hypothetical protein [Deltaproteobacteria bacterium]